MALVKNIQPRGPFDRGKTELEKAGYHIPSLEENARLRIQEGKDSYVSREGNWVKEGFLYIPNKGKFLTNASQIMIYPAEATNAHRKETEFYSTDEQVEISLKDSLKLPDKDFSVPTNRFGEEEITTYAFGNSAQDYGDFLNNAGIKEMPVWMVNNIGDKPFVRQAWLCGLVGGSGLFGNYRFLDYIIGCVGVREDALA